MTGAYFAVEHQGSASRSYEEQRAEALAEAGLNLALATLYNAPRATIYSSGRISFSNHAGLCGSANCDAAWNANQNLLAFVAGSSTDSTGFSLSNNTKFQGAVYAVTGYSESNFAEMWGPVIARQLSISNNTHNHYVPFGTLLPGMPATYEEVTVLAPVEAGFGE